MTEDGSSLNGITLLLRILAVIFLPITAAILVAVAMSFVGNWGQSNGLFYMRTESFVFGCIPFMIAILSALIARWTGSKKKAFRIFYIAVIGIFAFVGTATVFETIHTKPIVSAASTFKELPGLTREMKNNGDKFSPAPSGFVPCIDVMAEGCPSISRTWIANSGQELTISDLKKVLDDSGWTDVKIQNDKCDMTDHGNGIPPGCTAEGMVGDYKATVRLVKIQDWELRMYLRLPTNVR